MEQNPTPANRPHYRAKIASLQGLVGATLYFDDVIRVIVPMTQWWSQRAERISSSESSPTISRIEALLRRQLYRPRMSPSDHRDSFSSIERFVALAGLLLWVGKLERPNAPDEHLVPLSSWEAFDRYQPFVEEIVRGIAGFLEIVFSTATSHGEDDADVGTDGRILEVSLNRVASAALEHSIPAVKADAVQSMFNISCRKIVWAVLDSGIDGRHEAFMATDVGGKSISRIRKTLDFTNIREIVSDDANDIGQSELENIAHRCSLSLVEAKRYLHVIAEQARDGLPVNWNVVEKLITVRDPEPPATSHGTHVAGIIGADAKDIGFGGMCPDITLYDFRVLGKTLEETEFAIIAALQYIRFVNERNNRIAIHGANLSLSVPHNVRNFACGQTPVCNECERLVDSGVVVVTAAGNNGHLAFETRDGTSFWLPASNTITDPGNCESVITVGATHGNLPQTYGVSFFSSRGPTGDGRHKPDLLAPGEKVLSTVPGNEWAFESGTSMAAPHVSGAAAMLLSRYEDLIGDPRRLKDILCKSATNLGRDRNFQGYGMLDVLRAFQSI